MEDILHLIGLAKKAGRLEVGEEPVGAAARARQARLLLLAKDAAPNSLRRCRHFSESGQCLMITLPFSKEELGRAVGCTVCAMAALTDIGFASAITKKLAAGNPETYTATAEALDIKARRALERRREQARHEKNLRSGKCRPVQSQSKEEPEKQPEKQPETRPEKKTTGHTAARPHRAYRFSARRPEETHKKNGPRFAGSLPVKRGKGSGKKK